jgi:hypothetical protein
MATLATPRIVRQNAFFVNCLTGNIGVSPTIKFGSVKCNALLAYGKFPDMRAYRLVEDSTAHTQVSRSIAHTNKARQYGGGACHLLAY